MIGDVDEQSSELIIVWTGHDPRVGNFRCNMNIGVVYMMIPQVFVNISYLPSSSLALLSRVLLQIHYRSEHFGLERDGRY